MKRVGLFVLFSILAIAPAAAEVVRPMSSHPSAGQLQGTCNAVGGSFVDNTDIDPNGGYSCSKANCDGKGGECRVSCGTAGCTGTTPSRLVHPTTLLGILQDGNMVLHHQGEDDGSSAGGDSGPPSGGAVPPPPPPPPPPAFL